MRLRKRISDGVLDWLLKGDVAVRWQTMRDLAGAGERTVAQERRKVALQGWGARLLALQDPKGTWAGGDSPDAGLYSPKWISTTYTMLLLRDFGLPAGNRRFKRPADSCSIAGSSPMAASTMGHG